MALKPGDRIGSYVIDVHLGSGGMGEVYRARDGRLNRMVAIKLLLPAQAGDQERRARFLQEARSASALNHPNIITVYDIGCEETQDYLVMEYVAGQPLDVVIPPGGLREPRAIGLAVQIASAMKAAHGAGIVHRDLKPANVMVTESGLVKVLDFGLAKLLAPEPEEEGGTNQDETADARVSRPRALETGDGRIVGTAAYMSPEQAEGRKVDARSDIFAFGCMFYEMLTGINPFRRDSMISSLSAVLRDEPKPLHESGAQVSGQTEKVVQRCLRKEPERRFQSSADLAVVLQELKEESESGGLAVAAKKDVPKKPWLKRAVWGSIAALLLIVAGVAYHLRGRSAAPAAPLNDSLLVSLPGFLAHPDLSAGGNQVAFAWDGGTGGLTQIYLKVVGAGEPLRLTDGTEYASAPVWSPDGSSIAYLSSPDNNERLGPSGRIDASSTTRLLVISALGGAPREIASYNAHPRPLSWSVDGKFVVVSMDKAVYAISVGNKEQRKILDAPPNHVYRAAILSPDGHTLALIDSERYESRPEGKIYLVDVGPDGSAQGVPRLLRVSQDAVNSVAWTADSKGLVYGGAMSMEPSNLWRVPIDGGSESKLGTVGEGVLAPTIVGPSGRHGGRMVYMHMISDTDIWKIPMQNGTPGQAVPLLASTKHEWDPRFSPDGTRIAYNSDQGGASDIWVANADGYGTVQVTDQKGSGWGGARWSPDGKQIVFITKVNGQGEIYLVDAQGGTPVRITDNPAHDTAPMWSPDGRWIYFTSNRSGQFELWKVLPRENETPIQVTHHGGYSVVFSGDGKEMFYSKRNPAEGIWKQDMVLGEPSGTESQILPIHLSNWGNFDVSRDGIVYVPVEKGAAHIYFYRFADKSTTQVVTITGIPDFGISLSPVDGSIIFAQVTKPRRELVLVDNFQ